jgi:hypothetical protein
MGRKQTVTRTEVTDDAGSSGEDEVTHDDSPLFSNKGSKEDERIAKIDVQRLDPEEGFLGKLSPDASEAQIFERWGGGKFAVVAKNEKGTIVTRTTVLISGDPIFQSEVAEMRYRRANGLPLKKGDKGGRDEGEFSAKELMALMETKLAAERADAETRDERRRREDAEREEKARKDEREWRANMERERAEREARVRADEREHQARLEAQRREDDKRREDRLREDEQRRQAEHERQLAAAMLAAKESQEKNQQFFTNMLAMAKAGDKAASDPMGTLTQILTIVEALKGASGDGPQDAVTALLSRLPETLQAAGSMVGGAIREAKGLPPVQHGEAGEGGESDPNAITLTGQAAQKTRELVTHLISKGHDPGKVLVAVANHLMGKGGPGIPAAPQPVAPQASERKPVRRKAKPRKHNPTASPVASGPAPTPMAKPPGAP